MPNPALSVDPTRTDSRGYYASDSSDPRFHIEAGLRGDAGEQVLSFVVVAQLPDGTRGMVRGSKFFTAMMDHFGDAAVDVIEGQWEDNNPAWSTNLDEFNRITGSTPVPEEVAATMVPTGIYATRRGFTRVTLISLRPRRARGRYTHVLVRFRK